MMKQLPTRLWFLVALMVVSVIPCATAQFRIHGTVSDFSVSPPNLTPNITVDLVYSPLSQLEGDEPLVLSTNTNASGQFEFNNLPGELEGEVRILQLPSGFVVPMSEQVRLHSVSPTKEVNFRAGPAAVLTGTIVVNNGPADLTKFTVEVNATEVESQADGSFLIPELPATQASARVIYQDGFYFDERIRQLPALTAGQTNTVQFAWHRPMTQVSKEGILVDAQGNVLPGARVRFLGKNTGVFVGTITDGNGFYRVYDLPPDLYTVRAFVGRWGVEQRDLGAGSTFDTTIAPPVITILGDNPATAECGNPYADAGATASSTTYGDLTSSITVTSNVDTGVTGAYTVTYSVTDPNGSTTTKTRAVNVVDATPPVVALNGPASITLECTTPYVEQGATASDRCAGDVTASIAIGGDTVNSSAPGTYVATYTATDPSGNTATVNRTITVADTTPPQLVILGENPVTVECGTSYNDAGASASDTCAGDLTGAITTTSNVNSSATGSYTVTYGVSDPSGNSVTAQRIVDVVDTTPPVIACPADQTVVPAACDNIGVFTPATATDACAGSVTVTCDPAPGSALGSGMHTVACTATDLAGNSSACSFNLTVLERLRVVFLPPLNDDNADDDIETDADVVNKFKVGHKVQHKVQILDCLGNDVTGSIAPLVTVKLDVTERAQSGATSTVINDLPENPDGVGDSGGIMVLVGNRFQFNLDTAGFAQGTINDPVRFFRSHVTVRYNSDPDIVVGQEDVTLESKP